MDESSILSSSTMSKMKIGMLNLIGNVPDRMSSHNAGYTFCVSALTKREFGVSPDLLKGDEDFDDYDAIVINNGVNYVENVYNFFGGVQEKTITKITKLADFNGGVFSFGERVDLNVLIEMRKELSHLRGLTVPDVELLNLDNGNKLILGDSHALSIYHPGFGISRNDGKTLFGALKDGGLLMDDRLLDLDELVVYFGNIDARFHFHRNGGLDAISDLCARYIKRLVDIKNAGVIVTVQALIPAEDESRKLPGTGLYKGKPFYGTREERQKYIDAFNELMNNLCLIADINFRGWYHLPKGGFEAPKFPAMEARQSVHIRPEYYMHINELIPSKDENEKQAELF